jgi:uncharacterized protein YndB with AHSA1/START domain
MGGRKWRLVVGRPVGKDHRVQITRSIVIDRPRGEVFAYVADARNDPEWCPKVTSTELVAEGRYAVVHKPIPGRPARELTMTCRAQEPPTRIEWHEDDGHDSVDVTYALEDHGGSTRFTQRSVARLSSRVCSPRSCATASRATSTSNSSG